MPIAFIFFLAVGSIFTTVDTINKGYAPKHVGLFHHTCKGLEITIIPVCHKVIAKEIK